jgi:hypothetical protein
VDADLVPRLLDWLGRQVLPDDGQVRAELARFIPEYSSARGPATEDRRAANE